MEMVRTRTRHIASSYVKRCLLHSSCFRKVAMFIIFIRKEASVLLHFKTVNRQKEGLMLDQGSS